MGSAFSNIVAFTLPVARDLGSVQSGADFLAGSIAAFLPPTNTAIEDIQSAGDFLSGAFTPVDPFFADVVLLLHFDDANGAASFLDSSLVGNVSAQAGSSNAVIQQVTKEFGTGALLSPQSTNAFAIVNALSYLITAGSPLDILSDIAGSPPDFTVEFWFNVPAGSALNHIDLMHIGDNSSTGPAVTSGLAIVFSLQAGNFTCITAIPGWTPMGITFSILAGQWHNVVLTRENGIGHLYLDGNVAGGGQSPGWHGYAGPPAGSQFLIGGGRAASNCNVAAGILIDEYRVTAGLCRYPHAAGNFTPAGPFPNS